MDRENDTTAGAATETGAQTPWAPLIDGAKAEEVARITREIADALHPDRHAELAWPRDQENPGLSGGHAGLALFFAYMAQLFPDGDYGEAAETWLGKAIDLMAEVDIEPALHGGFTGVAWVSQHLDEMLFEPDPEGEDSNEVIDETLGNLLTQSPWTWHYDLISGLAGYGVYVVERLPRPSATAMLADLVRRLDEMAIPHDENPIGRTWLTDPMLLPPWQRKQAPKGYYNLGAAHGMPALVTLLAAAVRAGVEVDRARPLLEDAVAWLLSTRLPEDTGSSFSAWIPKGGTSSSCRLAWCYGDPGVLACLLATARAIGRDDWERAAMDMAHLAAKRNMEESGVKDTGLCHGAAGLLQIFNRMFQTTGDPVMGEAARYWLDQTLAMREPGKWLAGFWEMAQENPQNPESFDLVQATSAGFLTGVAGVGLALASAISTIPGDWDRGLMISLRPAPRAG